MCMCLPVYNKCICTHAQFPLSKYAQRSEFTDWSFLSQVVELDLSTVVPCCSGPKLPHDKVPVTEMKPDFQSCLSNKIGRKVL